MDKQKTILFLCTGNYFRSRFAEYYFNHFAKGLPWVAKSRGLALFTYDNVGPVSSYTIQELQKIGITIDNPNFPIAVKEEDFENADKIIALSKKEHEPMIAKYFPKWQNLVSYWEIGDIDVENTTSSFKKMEILLDKLIAELRQKN